MDHVIELASATESQVLLNRDVLIRWATPSEYFAALDHSQLTTVQSIDSRPYSLNINVET